MDVFKPGEALVYGTTDIVVNMGLAVVLGMVISWIYRYTHKGLSYSQSFVLTLVFVCVIVSAVMMVIGNSLARAFALVGTLSIIRFRTVVKDTKDVAYVFFALSSGLASGTGNYFIALFSTAVISSLAFVLYHLNYGSLYKSEFILRFQFDKESGGEEQYIETFSEMCKKSTLLHLEPSGDGKYITLTYDITLKDSVKANDFTTRIDKIEGVSAVTLIVSKSDVDF